MHFRAIRKTQGDVSLSGALDGSDEAGALSLMDVISVDDTMLEDLDARDSRIKVRNMVEKHLPQRERNIIKLRYGLDSSIPKTQREIATECGISRSYVSRIEKKALKKLKEEFDKEENAPQELS